MPRREERPSFLLADARARADRARERPVIFALDHPDVVTRSARGLRVTDERGFDGDHFLPSFALSLARYSASRSASIRASISSSCERRC